MRKTEYLLYFQYGILNYHLHKSDKDEHDPRFNGLKILVYIIESIYKSIGNPIVFFSPSSFLPSQSKQIRIIKRTYTV